MQNYTLDDYDLDGVLNNQYKEYSKSELVIDGRSYLVDCPEKVDENTTFCIAGRGAGGLTDVNSLRASSPDQNVVVVVPVELHKEDYEGAIDLVKDMASKTGANGNASIYSGHSASGPLVTAAAISDLKESHAAGGQSRATIILNDTTGERSIFNQVPQEDVSELDDSLVIANLQARYIVENPDGTIASMNGRLATYDQDLEDAARAGAAVVISAYDIDNDDRHTDSVDVMNALGLQRGENSLLMDENFSFPNRWGNPTTCRTMNYYYFDPKSDQWVKFESAKDAQVYIDTAEAKIALYNSGFLQKENGTYYINTPDGLEEVSEMDIQNMVIEYNRIREEEGKPPMSMDEYIKARLNNTGSDGAEFNLVDTGRAVETLYKSLNSIGIHMRSLTDIKGLSTRRNTSSKFLSSCPSFPSGVNTSALSAAGDCISKMGVNLETAYNAALAVHNALLETEGIASTYYKSSTYGYEAAHADTNTKNFANDHTVEF